MIHISGLTVEADRYFTNSGKLKAYLKLLATKYEGNKIITKENIKLISVLASWYSIFEAGKGFVVIYLFRHVPYTILLK